VLEELSSPYAEEWQEVFLPDEIVESECTESRRLEESMTEENQHLEVSMAEESRRLEESILQKVRLLNLIEKNIIDRMLQNL
jgi:hypothetical protein